MALTLLLAHLGKKAAPFTVADAYAGDALYDLGGAEALKTRESETGIARLAGAADSPPAVARYLAAVRAVNPANAVACYPGSPALVRAMLRGADRLIANELHPTAHQALAVWARGERRISVHRRDALEFLGWVATPRLRRGLVLLDPAYEVKSEYRDVPEALARAVKIWPGGIYALWFPVLAEGRHRAMIVTLAQAIGTLAGIDGLIAEIAPKPAPASGMRGAGLIVINPPWGFAEEMAAVGAWLAGALWAPGMGCHTVRPLSTGSRVGAVAG